MNLNNGYYDQSLQSNIVTMCNHLKLCSHKLETFYKGDLLLYLSIPHFKYYCFDYLFKLMFIFQIDQLDRAFIAIRNGSQDENLDMTTRVHLLELIELRAKQWHQNESMNAYYSQKLSDIDNVRLKNAIFAMKYLIEFFFTSNKSNTYFF